MVLLWLLLTISKIVIINGANLEESMIEEKHLQSRYQSKGEWFQRLDIVMLQATGYWCFKISSVNLSFIQCSLFTIGVNWLLSIRGWLTGNDTWSWQILASLFSRSLDSRIHIMTHSCLYLEKLELCILSIACFGKLALDLGRGGLQTDVLWAESPTTKIPVQNRFD